MMTLLATGSPLTGTGCDKSSAASGTATGCRTNALSNVLHGLMVACEGSRRNKPSSFFSSSWFTSLRRQPHLLNVRERTQRRDSWHVAHIMLPSLEVGCTTCSKGEDVLGACAKRDHGNPFQRLCATCATKVCAVISGCALAHIQRALQS